MVGWLMRVSGWLVRVSGNVRVRFAGWLSLDKINPHTTTPERGPGAGWQNKLQLGIGIRGHGGVAARGALYYAPPPLRFGIWCCTDKTVTRHVQCQEQQKHSGPKRSTI